ncbi:MAG TPA: hypothetical protein VIT20_04830 [Propionibacteriaceae bacterium]
MNASAAPTRGARRVLRIGLLGGSSLALACLAHVVGGGVLPSAGVLLVTAAVLGLVATTATARRRRFGALFAVLTAEQVLLHLLFTAAAGVGTTCAHVAHTLTHLAPSSGCVTEPGHLMSDPTGTPTIVMWAAHTAAIAGTAWLLARGEAWLFRTADRLIAAAHDAPLLIRSAADASAVTVPVRVPAATQLSMAAPRGPPASANATRRV